MEKSVYKALFILVVAIPMIFTSISYGAIISYQVTDLANTTPGQDLWQYSYKVSNYTFNQDYGFTILFDHTLYANLEDPPPAVNSSWSPLVFQPDSVLSSPGAYDALALADNASLSDLFTVSFIWLGTGTPGSQPFDVYHMLSDDSIETISSHQTSSAAPVPIPPSLFLLGSGLIGLIGIRKRFGRRA